MLQGIAVLSGILLAPVPAGTDLVVDKIDYKVVASVKRPQTALPRPIEVPGRDPGTWWTAGWVFREDFDANRVVVLYVCQSQKNTRDILLLSACVVRAHIPPKLQK